MRSFIALFCLLPLLCAPASGFAESAITQSAYARLDKVSQQKKEQILDLFAHLQTKADGLKNDQVMHEFFFSG